MKKITYITAFISLFALGTIMVSCEKDDFSSHENQVDLKSGKSVLMVNPDGTSAYILKMVPVIEELAESGYMNKGNSHALIRKVENTAASIQRGNTTAAYNQLKAFISQLEGLKAKETIPLETVRDLINLAGNGLILIKGRFLDVRDGYNYKVVLMGDKIWMAENLKYLPYLSTMPADYAPGDEILNTENPGNLYYVYQYWGSSVEEAKQTYAYKTAGVLYTHIAAVGAPSPSTWPVGASPAGWHVATNEEWDQLAQFVSNKKGPYIRTENSWFPSLVSWTNVGLHLKSTTGWYANNGTNDFGFNAYPTGSINAKYNSVGDNIPRHNATWWTSTPQPPGALEGPVYWNLKYSDNDLSNDASEFPYVGFAVRCVKD